MNTQLVNAVIEQLGGDSDDREEVNQTLEDVANNGADAGYSGFTYYADTCEFFTKNKSLIVELVKEYAEEFGQDAISVIAGWNCLEDDTDTRDEIERAIYGTPEHDDVSVQNALAWFALEEVAREEAH